METSELKNELYKKLKPVTSQYELIAKDILEILGEYEKRTGVNPANRLQILAKLKNYEDQEEPKSWQKEVDDVFKEAFAENQMRIAAILRNRQWNVQGLSAFENMKFTINEKLKIINKSVSDKLRKAMSFLSKWGKKKDENQNDIKEDDIEEEVIEADDPDDNEDDPDDEDEEFEGKEQECEEEKEENSGKVFECSCKC